MSKCHEGRIVSIEKIPYVEVEAASTDWAFVVVRNYRYLGTSSSYIVPKSFPSMMQCRGVPCTLRRYIVQDTVRWLSTVCHICTMSPGEGSMLIRSMYSY